LGDAAGSTQRAAVALQLCYVTGLLGFKVGVYCVRCL